MDPRLTRLTLRTSLSSILDLVLPRVCIVCNRQLLPREKHICMCCEADIPQTYYWTMSRNPMADKFNSKLRSDQYEPYAYAAALFFYDAASGYSRITQALKYNRNIPAGRHFARMLGEKLAQSPLYSTVDLVVPVPLHRSRLRKRGYNQAQVIAREIALCLGAELSPHLLQRIRRTTTQTLLSGSAKETNVSGAFALNHAALSRLRPQFPQSSAPQPPESQSADALPQQPRHILLVDDVFTSGATLSACYRALRTHFPPSTRISAATLAYVGVV